MERKANYVLIGLFTFAVVAGAFGFVFWIHHSAGKKQSVLYRVIFDTSVSGLRRGAPNARQAAAARRETIPAALLK